MSQEIVQRPAEAASAGMQLAAVDAAGAFNTFSKTLVTSMKEIHAVADSSASTFLYTLGTVVLFLSVFLRVGAFGISVSTMQPVEFMTVAILAVVLIVIATALRFYQAWFDNQASRALREVGVRIIKDTQETARILLERAQAQALKSLEAGPERKGGGL
jgi:sulfite exporter TauE/SafE